MSIDFMILGAQKAATTTLQARLRTVPGLYMPQGESPVFEDPEYARREWLRFGDDRSAALVGIKRPNALCRVDQVERVTQALPDARFVVVLRDPVSRAVSAYYHLVRHGLLPLRDLDEGITRCLAEHSADRQDTIANSVVRFGLYGDYLAEWFARAEPTRFLVLSQGEVRADPELAVARCVAHVGLRDPAAAPVGSIEANVGIYDPRALRLYRWGHQLKTVSLGLEGRRVPRRSRVGRVLGAGLTRVAGSLADAAVPPPVLGRDVRGRLEELYAEDLQRLRSLVPAGAIDWDLVA